MSDCGNHATAIPKVWHQTLKRDKSRLFPPIYCICEPHPSSRLIGAGILDYLDTWENIESSQSNRDIGYLNKISALILDIGLIEVYLSNEDRKIFFGASSHVCLNSEHMKMLYNRGYDIGTLTGQPIELLGESVCLGFIDWIPLVGGGDYINFTSLQIMFDACDRFSDLLKKINPDRNDFRPDNLFLPDGQNIGEVMIESFKIKRQIEVPGASYHRIEETKETINNEYFIGRRKLDDHFASYLRIVKGDITKVKVDVIVNPSNEGMVLGGGVSGAILKNGGATIQEQLDSIARNKKRVGDLAVTNTGNLKAKKIFHIAMPGVNNNKRDAIVVEMITKCINKLVEDPELISIAFPAIGAGNFRYSIELSARLLLDAIAGIFQKTIDLRGSTPLILIVLYDDNSLGIFSSLAKEYVTKGIFIQSAKI